MLRIKDGKITHPAKQQQASSTRRKNVGNPEGGSTERKNAVIAGVDQADEILQEHGQVLTT